LHLLVSTHALFENFIYSLSKLNDSIVDVAIVGGHPLSPGN